jgi:hypothetical protein
MIFTLLGRVRTGLFSDGKLQGSSGMKAYRHLVKHALKQGFVVSVYDGEDWSVRQSDKFKQIIDEIEGLDEATINIWDIKVAPTGNGNRRVGTALILPGLNPDETVADHSDNLWFNNWWKAYEETL